MVVMKRFVCAILLLYSLLPLAPMAAQGQTDCGVVDDIDYPIDSISRDRDDFGMYRQWFNGYHAGVDMAFDRPGETIQAAAKGRITFSDIAGWDTEKGVVIIEHRFPDGNTYFSLYGHMEESDTIKFPAVGGCIEKGAPVGVVGRPSQSAPHLHFEVRKMRASIGGPGYWNTDPLDGGWLHPVDFVEQWKLRFRPEFRSGFSATNGLVMPPLTQADGSFVLVEDNYLEALDTSNQQRWRLNVRGLVGAVLMPDGSVLGRTQNNQVVVIIDGRFVTAWNVIQPLRSPPFRLGNTIAFISDDDSVVGYGLDGTLLWQTPLYSRAERWVQSGDKLAISAYQDGYKFWVIDSNGALAYQGTAPAPITPISLGDGSFLILVASQIALLKQDMSIETLMDAGQPLGRDSQIARDAKGNIAVYPGQGNHLYLFDAQGTLLWRQPLPIVTSQPPLLAMGTGCLIYALGGDGTMIALRPEDGTLANSVRLFAGGNHYSPSARMLRVAEGEQVQFSPGYLSVVTIDGAVFGGATCQ
jgi:murein DD-endopeptidase MepM/ murein hydrolase activator NlpD